MFQRTCSVAALIALAGSALGQTVPSFTNETASRLSAAAPVGAGDTTEKSYGLGDLDGDGDVDANDSLYETLLSVWRQEAPGQPWFKVLSKVEIGIDEIEADITGFTGYALAY